MQGRESVVARADRHVPVVFQVVEERLHQRNVDVLEAEAFRRDPASVAAEPQEQREGVAVGPDRVRAEVPSGWEVVGQKASEVHGEVGGLHECALRGMTSPNAASERAVTSGNSSAVR